MLVSQVASDPTGQTCIRSAANLIEDLEKLCQQPTWDRLLKVIWSSLQGETSGVVLRNRFRTLEVLMDGCRRSHPSDFPAVDQRQHDLEGPSAVALPTNPAHPTTPTPVTVADPSTSRSTVTPPTSIPASTETGRRPSTPPQPRASGRKRSSEERDEPATNSDAGEDEDHMSVQQEPVEQKKKRRRVAIDILQRRLKSSVEGKDGQAIVGSAQSFVAAREQATELLRENEMISNRRDQTAVDSIVQFWALRVFSHQGFNRLLDFIKMVRDEKGLHPARTPDQVRRSRVECSKESETLLHVYDAYWQQASTRADAVVAKCMRYLHLARFAESYNSFEKEVCTPKSDMRNVLEKKGCRTGKGRNWSDAGIDWLVARVEGVPIERVHAHAVTRRRIRNEIYLGRIILTVQQAFGPGVFPLLPDNFVST